MSRTTQPRKPTKRRIVAGVDTHAETHHAAVVGMNGTRLADAAFPATPAGYDQLLEWVHGLGRLHATGVEGTSSYGAALARHLTAAQITVVEVNRPDRRTRRAAGKSDALDAYAAAEAVLARRATAVPKAGTGTAEAIRILHTTRAAAVKARTAAINHLRALLVTAPADLREQLRRHPAPALIDACTQLRPAGDPATPDHAARTALAALARRHQALTAEITDLETHLHPLVEAACPRLLALHGVGYETAAQLLTTAGDNPDRLHSEAAFAALCGTAPLPASSGKTTRHRLSRGGDRQANRALHLIACTRLAHCPRTRAYRDRRTREGHTTKDILRSLKRYIAREIYKTLTTTQTTPTPPLDTP